MTPISRSLAEVLDHLTAAQLAELAAVKREREQHSGPSFADEQRRLADKADPETCDAFDDLEPLEVRFGRIASIWRGMGIDDDITASHLIRQATSVGIDQSEANRAVMDAGIEWEPRTAEQRMVAVAREMLEDGWSEGLVRRAMARVEP